jgi:hypothetical protein
MPEKSVWLIMLFTACFILGINPGDLSFLPDFDTTVCLSGSGVG